MPSAQKARFSRCQESVATYDSFGSGGPVTQAIRATRSADADANLAPVFPGFGEKLPHGIRALPRVEVDPELRAIRDTAERMIADSRAARFRAIQSLRRVNAPLRSARATLNVGGRA